MSGFCSGQPYWAADQIALRQRCRKDTIKQAMGFRQFLFRGLARVQAEWTLVCTAHNLLKLIRATA